MLHEIRRLVYAPILGAALMMGACDSAPTEKKGVPIKHMPTPRVELDYEVPGYYVPDLVGVVCGYDRGVTMRGEPGNLNFAFSIGGDQTKLECDRIITPTDKQKVAIDQILGEMGN